MANYFYGILHDRNLHSMFRPPLLLLYLFLALSFAWFVSGGRVRKHAAFETALRSDAGSGRSVYDKMRLKADEARTFIARKGYDKGICFLVDMSLPSGTNRFFVYDLNNDTLVSSGLVAHGRCNQNWLEGRKYGNTVGCGCTSLGKYKIGHSYSGRFGLAFKLYGLDKTNDKAFDRFVVLHSYDCVPPNEQPGEICQSDGCPMVSPGFLQHLKPVIEGRERPVLLWIYE
ncbi:MAG TPA: murein L,D-transpeptidase catalytic domain family protein [Chitinophagaceae bacterium]|nr:murein L,D-transpeptidase catalytic domain family protein [Chitinophagaceae bacterium]